METPVIRVGIISAEEISFSLKGVFSNNKSKESVEGDCKARIQDSKIQLIRDNTVKLIDSGTIFNPQRVENAQFILFNVVIGINFHWERKEDQVFKGSLQFIIENEKITVINILTIEDYLISVISSEMSATSSEELLKAHAVISRSWLLAQIVKSRTILSTSKNYQSYFINDEELTRWFDREDHANFDVCADDHCQRYQGITRATTPFVEKAVKQTWGELLIYGHIICDARFSKCCGGVVEVFENVWEPVNHPYLQKVVDNPKNPEGFGLNLNDEQTATKWIKGNPDAFCNSSDKKVLTQILNDYDQETNDFFRWKVEYTQKELSELIKVRTDIDFGLIQELIPIERGVSGRLIKLKIVGDKKTLIIGKELQIRKALSKTHLYSSAFTIDKKEEGRETKFVIAGAGWGHGVGLCQIGAAVMADKGYTYDQILSHYFKGAGLEKRY